MLRTPVRRLPINNDWKIEVELTENGVALADDADVTGFIADDADGDAIDDLSATLEQVEANPKLWRGVISGADLTAQLDNDDYIDPDTLKGEKVWEVVTVNGTQMRIANWLIVEYVREGS